MKYQNVSQLYDTIYKSRTVDTIFYKNFIAAQKSVVNLDHVLEIGAGTGRVLLPIAQDSDDINFTAIDIIGDELEVLKQNAKHMGLKNIRTVCQDLCDFEEGSKFSAAIAPFRVFQHCVSIEMLDSYFKNVNDLLLPDGKFVFDLFNPSIPMLEKTGTIFEGEYNDEEGNKILRKVNVNERDYFSQIQKVEEYYNVQYADQTSDDFEWIYSTRYYFKDEVLPLLIKNNFSVDNIYGSFDGKEFGKAPYPGELIFVCSKLRGPL